MINVQKKRKKLIALCPKCRKFIYPADIDVNKLINSDADRWPIKFLHYHINDSRMLVSSFFRSIPEHAITLYLHSDMVIRSIEVVPDEKTRYTELKKLVLSSPEYFKVFKYLSLQMDNKSKDEIEEGTKLEWSIVNNVLSKFERSRPGKLVDSNEIKDITSKTFKIPGTHYYFLVKNELVDALREEFSRISPEKYLDEYFASLSEQCQKSIVSTQEGLEKLLVEFNDNTLSVKDFLRRAANTANCSEEVVIDEVLAFIASSTALRRVVKSYDKEVVVQPRDLCEINGASINPIPEFKILSTNALGGIEYYARCNKMNSSGNLYGFRKKKDVPLHLRVEDIPLHFYGAIANRSSKGELEKFLRGKGELEKFLTEGVELEKFLTAKSEKWKDSPRIIKIAIQMDALVRRRVPKGELEKFLTCYSKILFW